MGRHTHTHTLAMPGSTFDTKNNGTRTSAWVSYLPLAGKKNGTKVCLRRLYRHVRHWLLQGARACRAHRSLSTCTLRTLSSGKQQGKRTTPKRKAYRHSGRAPQQSKGDQQTLRRSGPGQWSVSGGARSRDSQGSNGRVTPTDFGVRCGRDVVAGCVLTRARYSVSFGG